MALKTLINNIFIIWGFNKQFIALLLLLNMAKIFNNIVYAKLLYNLKVKKVLIIII